jgi:hypothetical protein
MAFVAFLWQIPPIGPVLPTYNRFAVNNLRVDRLHTVEVVGSNPAVPPILSTT